MKQALAKTCKFCGGGDSLKQCGGCGRVSYCSVHCQKTDWKSHKPECKKSTAKARVDPVVRERCEFCSSEGHLKKCGSCLSVFYCNKDCQELDWVKHKPRCINKKPIEGTNTADKITEELGRLSTSNDKSVGPSGSDTGEDDVYICYSLQEAKEVVEKMFPSRLVVSNFRVVPTELCGFRLCQGQQLLVSALSGYHPDRKRHGMMICDEDNVCSFITFHVPSIPDPQPYFKWEELKPGNVLVVRDPCFQTFPGGFLGLVIDDKNDILILQGHVIRLGGGKETVELGHFLRFPGHV
ncbi:hypothetical protein ScPMuIL_018674 [Solemya velum]